MICFVDTSFLFALASASDPDHELLARIHWTTPAEEKQALDYLAQYKDQRYSPVDCISFVVMEALGIQEALTLDRDFAHRFIARPGPRPK